MALIYPYSNRITRVGEFAIGSVLRLVPARKLAAQTANEEECAMRHGNDTSNNTAKPKVGMPRTVSPIPDSLERLKNSNALRWYVLTLPVCHKGAAPGLQREVERRRRVGETPFEFFAPSFVEVKYVAGRAVATHRPLLFNYVFIRASERELFRIKRSLPQYNFLPRVRQGASSHYPYLTDEAMQNLRWVATAYAGEVPVCRPEEKCPMKGDRIKIVAGRFKGVEARVAVQPGGGCKRVVVCVEDWMWIPLLHLRPEEYEVVEQERDPKRTYAALDNERVYDGLHRAVMRLRDPEGVAEEDRALAAEVLRLYDGLQVASDVMRCKLYALLLPAYTILVDRELRAGLLDSVRALLPRVKSDAARGLLLVTLYGCTGGGGLPRAGPDVGRHMAIRVSTQKVQTTNNQSVRRA